jgi:hypothetical protein
MILVHCYASCFSSLVSNIITTIMNAGTLLPMYSMPLSDLLDILE